MNKFLTGLLIIGAITIIVGGGLIGVGCATSNGGAYETNEYKLDEAFEKINIDVETASVEIKASTDGQNKVVCYEKEDRKHTVKVADNKLSITYVNNLPWYKKIFNFSIKGPQITIYLADTKYDTLVGKINTGSYTINAGFTFGSMDLKSDTGSITVNSYSESFIKAETDTGNIKLNNVKAKNLDLESDTGSIDINNSIIEENIEAETDTGHINFESVKCNDVNANDSTGSIKFNNTIVINKITAKTSTGSIKFDKSDANTLSLKASTGSITGTLLSNKIFYCSSDTGRVNVPSSTDGGLCEAETDTGSINLSIVQ